MKMTKMIAAVFSVVLLLFFLWVANRARTLGITNVFSREHVFVDHRPLTEELAVELTGRTLEEEGYELALLAPVEDEVGFPEGNPDRIFSRNVSNPNRGKVTWGPSPEAFRRGDPAFYYNVSVEKDGDEIRCRVYRQK
jgi:hypothetical protein